MIHYHDCTNLYPNKENSQKKSINIKSDLMRKEK